LLDFWGKAYSVLKKTDFSEDLYPVFSVWFRECLNRFLKKAFPMKGNLFDDKVWISDEPQVQRLAQRGFGTLKNGGMELSLLESLYLTERGTLSVEEKGEPINRDQIIKRSDKESDFPRRYAVYKDLRERGFVVKTGFKFGVHFRVYERGGFSLGGHSAFLVHVMSEDSQMSFPELSRAVRLTQSVKKNLIFAIVDHEGDITYYQIERIIP
jgi:tRNA-intron endonuclease